MAEHSGHRLRMRERFRTSGLAGFADHEVLELILFYAIPQKNVNPLAHALLTRFGSLHAVLEAPAEALCEVDGIGENAASLLKLFSEIGRRLEMSRSREKPVIGNSASACEHGRKLLCGLREEHFYLIGLNASMELLGDVPIAKGTLSEVPAYPRLIAEAALRLNAHSVILCHNHPGGSLKPSDEDVESTVRLKELLESMGIGLVDHILVAGAEAVSMAELGLMTGAKDRPLPKAAEGSLVE